jgi:hypothetical protein
MRLRSQAAAAGSCKLVVLQKKAAVLAAREIGSLCFCYYILLRNETRSIARATMKSYIFWYMIPVLFFAQQEVRGRLHRVYHDFVTPN